MRKLGFSEACRQFCHRFTMQHVPAWAKQQREDGTYYAPPFVSDNEWYDKTKFKGEHEMANSKHCYTTGETWPVGKALKRPFDPKEWDGCIYIGDGEHPTIS